eukprot:1342133-Amorphochlora_amoeboformis.AAC.3
MPHMIQDPPEKTPELEEFLGPIPDLNEPALEKSWDGWSKDDLQDPREEVLQKKYREIFREAA